MFVRDADIPVRHPRLTIPGRFVLPPINTGFARNGRPDIRLVRFHRVRAGPGLGIAFVGNVAVDLEHRTNPGTTVLAHNADVPRLAVVARTISSSGTLPGIQLASAPTWLSAQRGWLPRDQQGELERLRRGVESASTQELSLMVDNFVRSAALAAAAGFSVIQIHAAHGYSISLLLDPSTNRRTDQFAADGRWLSDLSRRLRVAIGLDRLLTFRLSLYSGLRAVQEDLHRVSQIADYLISEGADAIDISGGFYTLTRKLIYPNQRDNPPYLADAITLAKTRSALVIVSGAIRDLSLLDGSPPNLLVGIGRPLLADPRSVETAVRQRLTQLTACCSSGRCHFATRGRPHIECGRNPKLGITGE